VVLDIEPVAHIAAGSVDGQGLAGQSVDDGECNELFGKLIRPVVVGAVRGRDLKPEGSVISAHQVIGGRF
jgi:hypothetical protein